MLNVIKMKGRVEDFLYFGAFRCVRSVEDVNRLQHTTSKQHFLPETMLSVYTTDEALENREKPTQLFSLWIPIHSLAFGLVEKISADLNQADLSKSFFFSRAIFWKQPLIGIASMEVLIRAHNTLLLHQHKNCFMIVFSSVVDVNAKWLFVSCLAYLRPKWSHETRIMSAALFDIRQKRESSARFWVVWWSLKSFWQRLIHFQCWQHFPVDTFFSYAINRAS